MATRCYIGILNNHIVTSIYCHFDGYPSGVGKTLVENWQDTDDVRALLHRGDLSKLGATLDECVLFSGADTVAVSESFEDFVQNAPEYIEYMYLLTSNGWHLVDRTGEMKLLPTPIVPSLFMEQQRQLSLPFPQV